MGCAGAHSNLGLQPRRSSRRPLCATLSLGPSKTIRATRPCSEDWRIGERPSQLHGQPEHSPTPALCVELLGRAFERFSSFCWQHRLVRSSEKSLFLHSQVRFYKSPCPQAFVGATQCVALSLYWYETVLYTTDLWRTDIHELVYIIENRGAKRLMVLTGAECDT